MNDSKSTPSRNEQQQPFLTPPQPKTPTHSSSPNKPRLLWRGSLHLSDGTELPGLAIVSTIQPVFGSSRKKINNEEKELIDQENKQVPFTLSREQQDELSLSIEMVRHAPLKVVDVVENSITVDDQGKLSISKHSDNHHLTDSKKQNGSTENSMGYMNKNVQVTFEAAGDVRMYIDPKQQSTLAFFDRLFTYNFNQQTRNHSSCVLVFSLDKSYKDTIKSTSLSSSELSSLKFFNGAISEWQQSTVSSSSSAMHGYGVDTGIMEAVVIGVKRDELSSSKNDQLVELHIGRKIVRRIAPTANTSIKSSSRGITPTVSSDLFKPPRPDDPAPRGISLENKLRRSITPLPMSFPPNNENQPALLKRKNSTNQFALPLPPSFLQRQKSEGSIISTKKGSIPSDEGQVDTKVVNKKRGGNHTPGRRGEKRPKGIKEEDLNTNATLDNQREEEIDPFIVVKQEEGSTELIGKSLESNKPTTIKRAESRPRIKKDSLSDSLISTTTATTANAANTSSIEDKNRSLIKKLVHYQLLGKGVEKHEPAYYACFGITCQGTMVALRKTVKIEPIDRQMTASIIEKHLEMYL